jgi:hypothetical protein
LIGGKLNIKLKDFCVNPSTPQHKCRGLPSTRAQTEGLRVDSELLLFILIFNVFRSPADQHPRRSSSTLTLFLIPSPQGDGLYPGSPRPVQIPNG